MSALTKSDILRLFELLNAELKGAEVIGELYLLGGAVMCLVFNARPSTRDVDAVFVPTLCIREAAAKVAEISELPVDWLNDSVKGFLSDKASFDDYLELSNLRIFVPTPEYLLAMKCLAMRIGEEFFDLDDIRYLLRYLNITSYKQAVSVIERYYPLEKFPQKTLYALEELGIGLGHEKNNR